MATVKSKYNNGNVNFQSPEEYIAYLDWIQQQNNCSREDAIGASIYAGAKILNIPVDELDFDDDTYNKIYPSNQQRELLPFEKGYKEQEEAKASKKYDDMSFIDAANQEGFDDKGYGEQLEKLVTDYTKILDDMRSYVHDNNSGYGMSEKANKAFAEKLQEYKDKLKSIEESPELYHLMEGLAEGGTGELLGDNGILNSNINSMLQMIATGEGSKLFENRNRRKNWVDSVQGTKFDNIMTALYGDANDFDAIMSTFLTGPVGQGIRSSISGQDPQDIAKKYMKTHSNPANKKNIQEGETTDSMKFGKDVDSQQYVNDRNKQLAIILANKGLTSEEDIDKFLSQYDSWKNADAKNKAVTLHNLAGASQNNYNKYMAQREKDLKEKEDKERVKQGIGKKLDLAPSNDSPLNGEEEERPIHKITKKVNEQAKALKERIDNKEGQFDGSEEAQNGIDLYNKYMQLKAEGGNQADMKKFFSSNAGILGGNSEKNLKSNMKKAGLTNNQINEFVSDWKNTAKSKTTKLDENAKSTGVKKLGETKKVEKPNVARNSSVITGLLKAKK